jgi:hypothetical protein
MGRSLFSAELKRFIIHIIIHNKTNRKRTLICYRFLTYAWQTLVFLGGFIAIDPYVFLCHYINMIEVVLVIG